MRPFSALGPPFILSLRLDMTPGVPLVLFTFQKTEHDFNFVHFVPYFSFFLFYQHNSNYTAYMNDSHTNNI